MLEHATVTIMSRKAVESSVQRDMREFDLSLLPEAEKFKARLLLLNH